MFFPYIHINLSFIPNLSLFFYPCIHFNIEVNWVWNYNINTLYQKWRKKLNRYIKKHLFFFFCLFIGYKGFVYYATNFSLASISYEWPEKKKWYPTTLKQTDSIILENILNQPYYYYSQGNQSYAFISKDGLYILKLFKFSHLIPPLWFSWIPDIPPFIKLKSIKHDSQITRLQRLYRGHWIAETYDKENCGVLAFNMIDLESTPYHFQITVFDRLGISHLISPTKTPFILQKKAIVARSYFNKYFKNNDLETIKSLVDKIFVLYLNEYKEGVYDRDHNVIDNIGFIEDRAMRIDVGKLQYDPKFSQIEYYLPDIKEKVVKRIKIWTKSHFL